MHYITYTPFIISEPGIYNLINNQHFSPSYKKQSAITIDSDNVLLNLNGFTLSQTNNTNQTTGITVNPGHRDITITNGQITNFSQLGITIKGNTQNIELSDLSVTNSGYGSTLAFKDGTDIIYQGGIQIGETYYYAGQGFPKPTGNIENLTMINMIVTKNCVGAWFGNGNNYDIIDCSFSDNHDNRPLGGPLLGQFFPPNTSRYVWGLHYFSDKRLGDPDATNWLIKNCKFNNNGTTAGKGESAVVVGCELSSLQKNVIIENCHFDNNYGYIKDESGYSYVHGFDSGGGDKMQFVNCVFNGNKGYGNVQGCHLSGTIPDKYPAKTHSYVHAKDVTLINCIASNNVCMRSSSTVSRSFGYGFDGNCKLNIIDCKAADNLNTNPKGQTAGLYITFDKPKNGQVIDVTIDALHASDNNGASDDSSDILLNDNVHNVNVVNSVLIGKSKNSKRQTNNGVCITYPKSYQLKNVNIDNNTIVNHKNDITYKSI